MSQNLSLLLLLHAKIEMDTLRQRALRTVSSIVPETGADAVATSNSTSTKSSQSTNLAIRNLEVEVCSATVNHAASQILK